MSGFCGFTGNKYNDEANTILGRMNDKIAHRGPDGEGYFVTDEISLAYRWLALSGEGQNQPASTPDGAYTVVLNGTIYNFEQLRGDAGCEAELLLNLYRQHGADMLPMLRGPFAFVIYDRDKGEIFAARDCFGIKPFYYGIFDGQLLFASEIKAMMEHPVFVKELNREALSAYLSFQYSVLPETFFKGVYRLPPAYFMRYCDGEITLQRWWQADFAPEKMPLAEVVNKIDDVVGETIATHHMGDVEIGTFLSSGVDSSLMAARFNGKKSFTVGFNYEDCNEIEYARNLSADVGLDHHAKAITDEEYWAELPKIQYHMDEPLADPAAAALYFVSREAARHVKVAFSGEGVDELFGGYNIYREPLSLRPITILPRFVRRRLAALAAKMPNFKGRNFFIRAGMDVEERFIGNAKVFSEAQRAKILVDGDVGPKNMDITKPYYAQVSHCDDVTKMQFLDMHLWATGDILLKADRMTMAHSLEVRSPYLDIEVFALARTLPVKYRIAKKTTKYAFRLAAARYLKPQWATKRKLGFPVPVRAWLRQDEYYDIVKAAFNGPTAARFFRIDELMALLDAHKEGKADNGRKVWVVYMFLVWYGQYFGE